MVLTDAVLLRACMLVLEEKIEKNQKAEGLRKKKD